MRNGTEESRAGVTEAKENGWELEEVNIGGDNYGLLTREIERN